jgi:hypothetical protein
MEDLEQRLHAAKDNAVLQAQIWAAEARGQRATVLEILRYFGLPERDYEALHLIRRHLEGSHAKCPTCGVAGVGVGGGGQGSRDA